MKKIIMTCLVLMVAAVTMAQTKAQDDKVLQDVVEVSKGKKGRKLTKIVLNYKSVDAQGKAATLSGAIFFPKKATRFDEIVLACHQTSTCDSEVPSGKATTFTDPMVIDKEHQTLVVASDYYGFGVSTDHVHPYMNQEMAARNEVDMLRAAMAYLRAQGYTFATKEQGMHAYCTGYSQGGGVALATQRELEKDEKLCEEINFLGSFCGDGPYSLTATFNYYVENDLVSLPIVLPYVIMGMYESYPEEFKGIELKDYFSDKMLETGILEALAGKKYGAPQFMMKLKKVSNKYSELVAKESLNLESKQMKALFRCLNRQSLVEGWTPKHKVVLYHSPNDTTVPYVNCEEVVKAFGKTGLVSVPEITGGKDHFMEFFRYTKVLKKGTFRQYF